MPRAIQASEWLYAKIFRKIFFLFDSEPIHEFLLDFGEMLGKLKIIRNSIGRILKVENPALSQNVRGLIFKNPIGLSAGFDYKAQLTYILPSIGFGFETVGTISNRPCEGNPKPRLGRLIKSKSLMVNKGFRNPGIGFILEKFKKSRFEVPIGLSIGKTNSPTAQRCTNEQQEAVNDIVAAFKTAEESPSPFSYYELNISCPNLSGNATFYPPENLRELLSAVTGLDLKKPLFIKMPIEKKDEETTAMLDVIISFPVQGVIFGNLQKNRNHPALNPEEVKKYSVGNFSGKPTCERSNELIALAYKNYGKRLTIIGCGGVFDAEDAYKKIKLGASLVQMITGLIFEGPQLPARINSDLIKLMEKDGYKNISDAVGSSLS